MHRNMQERRLWVRSAGFDPCDLFRELKDRLSIWMWRCHQRAVHPLEDPALRHGKDEPRMESSPQKPRERPWTPEDESDCKEQARWPMSDTNDSEPAQTGPAPEQHPSLAFSESTSGPLGRLRLASAGESSP